MQAWINAIPIQLKVMNTIDSAKPAIGQTSNNGSHEPFNNPKIKRAIHISPTKPHHPNNTFPSPLNTLHTIPIY